MKKYVFISIFLIFNQFCVAQKLKHKTIKFDKSKQISQQFTVLKSNKKIKHGLYISYFKVSKSKFKSSNYRQFKEKGSYENGKKTGFWIESLSPQKRKEGKYENGKKVGIWKTVHKNGTITLYNHSLNKKAGVWKTKRENGKVIERYDYDKNLKLQPIIRINTKYPAIDKENKIEGIVKITYNINENCEITNINLTQGITESINKEALKGFIFFAEMKKKYGFNCEKKSDIWIVEFKLN